VAESLRSIIVRLTTYACAWSVDEVVALSEVSLSGVRRYLTNLVHLDVLTLVGSQYRAGPQARAWRELARKHKGPSTYGNSARYRAQRAVWDQLRQRDWQEKRKDQPTAVLTSRSWSDVDNSGHTLTSRPLGTEGNNMGSDMSIEEVAGTLSVSAKTVRREIERGKIRAFRVGLKCLRVSKDEVERYRNACFAAVVPVVKTVI
jgi:excisionase family DNA binding protein